VKTENVYVEQTTPKEVVMLVNRLRITLSMLALVFLSLSLLMIAPAFAESDSPKIEGSWAGTVTAIDPPLGSFADLITFMPKGGVIESRRLYVPETPIGPLLETPGHGEWEKISDREFQVNFVFLLQGAPDNPSARGIALGTDNISMKVEINEEGTVLNGSFKSDVKTPDGNILLTTIGTYTAMRIKAEN